MVLNAITLLPQRAFAPAYKSPTTVEAGEVTLCWATVLGGGAI
jgi:hypothetical protein